MSSVQIQPPNPAGNRKTAVMGPKIPKGPGGPKKAGLGRPLPAPNPQTAPVPKNPGSTPPIHIKVPVGNQKTNSRSLPNSPPSIVSGNIARIESRSTAVSPVVSPGSSPRNNDVSDAGSPRMRPKPLPKAPPRKVGQPDSDLESTLSPRGLASSPTPTINMYNTISTSPTPSTSRSTPAQDIEASSSPKQPSASALSMLLAAEQVTGQKMTGYRTRIVDELLKKSRRSCYANDELVKGDASEDLKKRCLTITEIIESEKAFLRNMSSAIENYLNPSKNGESPVPENKARLMFNNLEQIIEVSTDLLQTMFDKIPNEFDSFALVGNIFVQFVPRFNVFDEYAKLHYTAIKTFGQLERKKEVVQYWKELRERTGVLDIMALLIMPVQRFLRHKLLLEELLKRTPEDHPDRGDVVKAIGAIDQFAHSVNENVKRHTALQKYNEIERKFGFPKELELPEGSEDIRIFIKEGTLMKVCRKEPKPRYFVLFEDLLVYGESGVLSYSIHRCLDLSKTSVKDVEDTSVMENAFEIYSTGKSFVVFADNIGEKKSWLNSFKQVKLLAANDNQAAIWVNDKMSKCCLKCGREFKAHFRRHHCRACGLLVCAKCSPKSTIVASVSSSKVRVCNSCFEDIANGITPKKASAHVPDNDLSSEDDDSSSEDDPQKLSRSQTSPVLTPKSNGSSPDVNRLQVKTPETHKRSTTTVPASNNNNNGLNDSATKKKNTFANLFTTLRGVGTKKKEGDQ